MVRYRMEMLSSRRNWVRARFPSLPPVKDFLSVDDAISCAQEMCKEWHGLTQSDVIGPAAAWPFTFRIVRCEFRMKIILRREYPVFENEKEVTDG